MSSQKKAKITEVHVEEAAKLRSRFAKRNKPQLSQAAFGEVFEIGSQAVVWQYLNARIPLNVEKAVKFAHGLNCSVADFSPRLAEELKSLTGKAIDDMRAASEAAEATTTHGSSAQQQPHKLWTLEEEAEQLAKKFASVNRAAFAREFRVPGGQAMIYQHISGRRPISMECAKAYAAGFNVSLEEISPRLAQIASSAAAFIATEASRSPDSAELQSTHTASPELAVDMFESTLKMLGLSLDAIGGRTALTKQLSKALAAKSAEAPDDTQGFTVWDLNRPESKPQPFFSKAKASREKKS